MRVVSVSVMIAKPIIVRVKSRLQSISSPINGYIIAVNSFLIIAMLERVVALMSELMK